MRAMIGGLGLILFAAPASPQVPACAAPAPFAGWEHPATLTASPSRRVSPMPTIEIGHATTVSLAPVGRLLFDAPPGRPGDAGSHGGMVEFRVPLSGTYRVGLGGKAWVDVARAGKFALSSAHQHGPDCGPVRKIVDFPLEPGTYVLQLSDSAAPSVTVEITRLP